MGSRTFLGFSLVAVGLILLLDRLGVVPFPPAALWPLVLGLGSLYLVIRAAAGRSGWLLALGLLGLAWGGLDLAHVYGLSPWRGAHLWHVTWPLGLVAAGVALLAGGFWGQGSPKDPSRRWLWGWLRRELGEGIGDLGTDLRRAMGPGRIGDIRYGHRPWVFENLEIRHGLGDVEVDLTTATIAPGDHRLVVRAGAGDVEVRVPDDVDVTARVRVGAGDAQVFGHWRNGVHIRVDVTDPAPRPGPEPKRVLMDIALGAGDVRVRRAGG